MIPLNTEVTIKSTNQKAVVIAHEFGRIHRVFIEAEQREVMYQEENLIWEKPKLEIEIKEIERLDRMQGQCYTGSNYSYEEVEELAETFLPIMTSKNGGPADDEEAIRGIQFFAMKFGRQETGIFWSWLAVFFPPSSKQQGSKAIDLVKEKFGIVDGTRKERRRLTKEIRSKLSNCENEALLIS